MKTATVEVEPVSPVSDETRAALAVRVPQQTQALEVATEKPNHTPVTAAQAKVEAIANLTMKAYERAGTLVLTSEEIERLQKDFPDDAFKPGAAGKEHLIYIEHAFLRDRLNQVIGVLQWSIVPRNRWAEPFTHIKSTGERVDGSTVYVEAMLIIRGAFAAEAVGSMVYYPKNNSQDYSDAVEGAKTAALRRCCKEIGVGLQAWKKDWCEGWWQRTRGKKDPKHNPAATPMRQAQQAKAAATSAPAKSAPVYATKKTLEWFIGHVGESKGSMEAFLREISWLMPNELLEHLELRYVPVNKSEVKAIEDCLIQFVRGEQPKKPYEPHAEPEPEKKPKTEAKPKDPVPAPAKPADKPPHDPEWFWEVICPIPRKGMRRDDYLKNPDTIESLYDAGCNNDEEAARRLFGFMTHFEAKPWTSKTGKQMPPSESDIKFREALDAFAEWHEKHKDDSQGESPKVDPLPPEEQDVPV